MSYRIIAAVAVVATMVTGCVSEGLHTETLASLEESRETAETATDMEALEMEQARMSDALVSARSLASSLAAKTQRALQATQQELARERGLRKQAEIQIASLQDKRRQLEQLSGDIRHERDLLQAHVEDLTGRLATAEDTLVRIRRARTGARARLAALEQEKTRLSHALLSAQSAAFQAQQELDPTKQELAREQQSRREAERQLVSLQDAHQELDQLTGVVRRERDLLQARVEDLARHLETAEQALASGEQSLADAHARLATLEQEKDTVTAVLHDSRNQARVLGTELAAEQANVEALQKEKQQLLSGTTTAQDEIARLQRLAAALETEAAQARELDQQLQERDQEIGRLRQAAAGRETLATQVVALTDEREQIRQRVSSLTEELAMLSDEAARTRQERDELSAQVHSQQETSDTTEQALAQLRQREGQLQAQLQQQAERLGAAEMKKSRLEQERVAKDADIKILTQSRAALSEAIEAQHTKRNRLEQERAAKEAEIQRLAQTHEELRKSLEAEIAKGDIRIQQVRDRLTINMVDRIIFDSGQARVKPGGLKVLKHVSEVLKNVTDKQIRIEGHTDNVPIGPKIIKRFPTNWELSTARATSVVRYLIEKGGVDRTRLSAVGYADNRPVSGNGTKDGQAGNRRIEIVLYPNDLNEIASQIDR